MKIAIGWILLPKIPIQKSTVVPKEGNCAKFNIDINDSIIAVIHFNNVFSFDFVF